MDHPRRSTRFYPLPGGARTKTRHSVPPTCRQVARARRSPRPLWTTSRRRPLRRTLAQVEPIAYLGTVAGLVTLAVAAMRVVVGQLGRRIDALGDGLHTRIDDLTGRVARLEVQNDAIIGAVGDVAQRVAHLEGRSA